MTASSDSIPAITNRVPARGHRLSVGLRTMGYITFFLVVMLGGAAWMMYQVDVWFPQVHYDFGLWRFAGAFMYFAALSSFLGCTWMLMRNGEGAIAEFDPPSQLVQVGPYRWVRNPITLSVAFMLLGGALAFSSTGMLLGLFPAAMLAKLQSLMEERLLFARFGDEYLRYCQRVHRWIPRWPAGVPAKIETPHGPWKSSS